ncbi:MAG: cell envelope integrity protein TolA, partial [Betaproteobacteria bacterium]
KKKRDEERRQKQLAEQERKRLMEELERDLANADANAKREQAELEQRRASSRANDATEIERIKSQIRDKVKREWAWSGDNTKLEVKYRINLSANGDILDLQKIGASGDSSFDVSVSQAIRLAKPLPVPKDELLFRENFDPLIIRFTLDELRN